MSKLDETIGSITKPGTAAGKLFYGSVFFIAGILFTQIGFWNTLLVILLTAMGLFVGSSPSLRESVSGLVNKWFPPKGQRVTYDAEDLEKVHKALDKSDRSSQK